MNAFKSILGDIANGLKKIFTVGVDVAKAEEPFVDIAFPGLAALYNTTVAAVAAAENSAIVAGAQTGTGAQKLAMVMASIIPDFKAYAAAQGMPAPTVATVTNYVNAVVATVNAIPAANAAS